MKVGLDLQQEQNLILSPRLLQAIDILLLPNMELESYICEQILENPVLELEENAPWPLGDSKECMATMPWFFGERKPNGDTGEAYLYEIAAPVEESLSQHLLRQLNTCDISPRVKRIGLFIIESLDEKGYLTLPPAEISQILEEDENIVTASLALIRSFDPAGVAAENLAQCLILQIDKSLPQASLLEKIIQDHLENVAANRLKKIVKETQASMGEVQKALVFLRSLSPRPGSIFAGGEKTIYVTPDVIINKIENEFAIAVNDTILPNLFICNNYDKLRREANFEVRKYLEEKISSAQGLIKNLEKRKHTLYRLGAITADKQRAFLLGEVNAPLPLTMAEVAEAAELHESTVSRAVRDKYLLTPRGLMPWKSLFTGNIYAKNLSPEQVQEWIKAMIEGEDPFKPLSDKELAELLAQKGIDIPRRTVAKYRSQLGIGNSSCRKIY